MRISVPGPRGDASAVQAHFRWINEHIRRLYPQSADADEIDFVCECPDDRCFLTLTLPASEFDAARSDGTWLTAPEHLRELPVAA